MKPCFSPGRSRDGFAVFFLWRGGLALAVALGAGGCAKTPPPDFASYRDSYRVMSEEATQLGSDPVTQAFLAAAKDSMTAAGPREEKRPQAAVAAMNQALALCRVALASGTAFREEERAEDCVSAAADMRRAWSDALALMENSERITGQTVTDVNRDIPELAVSDLYTPDSQVALTPASARTLLDAKPVALARELQVPFSDLQATWNQHLQAALEPDMEPAERDTRLVLAARAVQELEYRIEAEQARRQCVDAARRSGEFSEGRDQALRALVDLERGLKESARAELEEERSRMQTRQQELYQALQQFEGKFATIHQEARGTIMSLKDILFDVNSATLKRDAEFNLVRVSTILQQFPEMHIFIEGHTDNTGSPEYNKKLSERRAQSVFDFLESQGVPQARMDWFGYGMTRPVAPNTDAAGRAKNRRVDLVIGEQ